MRRDDRDDPFEDLFRELNKMMNEMMGVDANVDIETRTAAGFGADTHVDIYEEGNEVRVVADLPGVAKEHIDLTCDGDVLTIHAKSDAREYDERIRLPARVDKESASATYNNGILEVVLERSDESAAIDVE